MYCMSDDEGYDYFHCNDCGECKDLECDYCEFYDNKKCVLRKCDFKYSVKNSL